MPEPTGAAVTPADPMSATPFNNNNNAETVVKEVAVDASATVSSRFWRASGALALIAFPPSGAARKKVVMESSSLAFSLGCSSPMPGVCCVRRDSLLGI